jgi:hypothetical protein
MATRPATAPVAAPSALGLPCFTHSMASQVSVAIAVESWVTSIAIPAVPFAPQAALPALKPNQPTHSMPAPVTVMVMLCGGIGFWG